MKNILISVFATISVLSLGYITYDKFIKENDVVINECNKEELCEECICDDENNFDDTEEETAIIDTDMVYTNAGNVYKLEVYDVSKIKTENIKLNGKTIKIQNKDDNLLINDSKKIEYAMKLYVTKHFILMGDVAQDGIVFNNVIDEKGNITNLEKNSTIGDFQAYDIYLTETGNIASVGADYCGIECNPQERLLKFSYINNKIQITEEKINK